MKAYQFENGKKWGRKKPKYFIEMFNSLEHWGYLLKSSNGVIIMEAHNVYKNKTQCFNVAKGIAKAMKCEIKEIK